MISRVRRIVCCFFFLAGVGLVQTGSSQKTGLLKPSGNPTIIQVSARLEEARGFLLGGNYRQAEELYQAVCREAGFTSLESIKVPIGRREHVLNVATK